MTIDKLIAIKINDSTKKLFEYPDGPEQIEHTIA